ncbi:hypothetical protein S40288_04760 [Stachybotrys chartarum IBT 40288]|nr:hypothetical protein S40288_04760 [Stachybotrys chartarum IBT 40288]
MVDIENTVSSRDSRLQRAFVALPIFVLTLLMLPAARMNEPIAPFLDNAAKKSLFELNGVSVPVIREFFGITILDEIFSTISLAFVQLISFADPGSYWQSLCFLTDFSAMYAIWMFESCRGANKKTFYEFPIIIALAAQIVTVGLCGSLYFYTLYIFCSGGKFASAKGRSIDAAYAAAVLPSIFVGYLVPLLFSYFHPSLESRHWWCWVWQIYPIWTSPVLIGLGKAWQSIAKPARHLEPVRITVLSLVIINASVYWYTIANSGMSLRDLFIAKHLFEVPQDSATALRTILQYDWLCSFGAALLWLGYSFWDLKAAGKCTIGWIQLVASAGLIFALLGVGNTLLLGWLVREEILVAWDENPTSKKSNKAD